MPSARSQTAPNFVLVIHGGAGVVPREELTPEHEQAARATLAEALRTGHAVLARGGAATDAVVAAIKVLEDSPLFNAGRGSVLAADGSVSMDASLMDGATRRAGACADVKHVKNPIELARAVTPNPSRREMDQLLATGEQVSIALMAMAPAVAALVIVTGS